MKQRKDGRWPKKVTFADGTSKFFYSTANTERKAELDIQKQIAEYNYKQHYQKHNFKAVADELMVIKETSVAYKTHESYTQNLQHLEPFFDYDIEDIKPSMVQKLLNELALKDYSYSLIAKVKTVFGMILDYAIVHNDIMISNYMRSIKIPKNAKKGKVTAPDDAIIEIIIDNAEKIEFGMWYMMLLCTGLRRGELAALQKKDIDFENKKISVTKAIEYWDNQPHLKDCPKTEDSIGEVPILSILFSSLQTLCDGLEDDDYLFGRKKPLTVSAIRRRTEKYCGTIDRTFKLHQLRHAYAKLLYCSGIDPKTMQKLLRHADFSTTMNIYTDFDDTVTDRSIELINNFMNKNF